MAGSNSPSLWHGHFGFVSKCVELEAASISSGGSALPMLPPPGSSKVLFSMLPGLMLGT